MPTDVPSVGIRIDPLTGLSQARMPMPVRPKPQGSSLVPEESGAVYDGPVKFYQLASTLRYHLQVTAGAKEHVVFALYDLRSTASLAGLACEMALQNRTVVHMVLLCPQDNTMLEIAEVNGINQQDCPIFWHDGRPDYNSQSSTARRTVAIQAALGHVHSYLRPTTVVIDEKQAKDSHFTAALRSRLDLTWTPLSIIPNDALVSTNWIASLDGRSLSLLSRVQIDIVIKPYESSSGSLIRLLRSLQDAHYAGLPLPRITVEIPRNIDLFALRYLESFRWPMDSHTSASKLTLRTRLDSANQSPAVASLRTLESFYPPAYSLSHVLVLDPDVEVSPDYLQYLYYLTLEYKYGLRGDNVTGALMGISLDALSSQSESERSSDPSLWTGLQDNPFAFLQSPSGRATLYFGDKWVELQDYLSLRLHYDPDLSKRLSGETETKTRDQPAWLRHASELMRARNYYVLYPTFFNYPEERLITIHSEAHETPEEFALPTAAISEDGIPAPSAENTVLSSENMYNQASKHHPRPVFSSAFLSSLAVDQKTQRLGLPRDKDIPLYSSTRQATNWAESSLIAERYSEQISLQLGGCKSLANRDAEIGEGIAYLFCDGDG